MMDATKDIPLEEKKGLVEYTTQLQIEKSTNSR
jgi:hypothetical protein